MGFENRWHSGAIAEGLLKRTFVAELTVSLHDEWCLAKEDADVGVLSPSHVRRGRFAVNASEMCLGRNWALSHSEAIVTKQRIEGQRCR